MTWLFDIFDPGSVNFSSMLWAGVFFTILTVPVSFWVSSNQSLASLKVIWSLVLSEFGAIINKKQCPGILFLPISMFVLILVINITGLFPYYFSVSSHLVFTLSVALPSWLGYTVYSWFMQTNFMFSHLVPLGTPVMLMGFMVLIELLSNSIRPLTLAVRLMANMIAGHLLLTLLGSLGSLNLLLFIILILLLMLMTLEFAVSVVQAYVISILSTLYISEVQNSKLALL